MYSDRAYATQKKKAERLERELNEVMETLRIAQRYYEEEVERRRALERRCDNLWTEGDRIGREYILYRMSNPRPPENFNAQTPMPPKERGH